MFKKINFTGIIVLVVILLIVQLGVGLVISPRFTDIIVEKINQTGGAKVMIERFHLWPVTLSVSLKGVKVFDSDGKEVMVDVGKTSLRVSILGLLSRKFILSGISMDDVEINLEGELDGSFNIQNIGRAEKDKEKQSQLSKLFGKKQKDWFSRLYDMVKKRASKEAVEEEKKEAVDSRKIKKEVKELPQGRRVEFKTVKDEYIFEIKTLALRNVSIHMKENNKDMLDVEGASIKIKGIAFGPAKGVDMKSASLKGTLKKGEDIAGRFKVNYNKRIGKKAIVTNIDFSAKDVDMKAVAFIYKDALPVGVKEGKLSIESGTKIVDENIDSRNKIKLKDYTLQPKGSGNEVVLGFMPISVFCEAMNKIAPLNIKFDITGTVDNPEFTGFEDTLKAMVKPAMGDLKEQGMSAITGFFKKKTEGEASAESGGESSDNAVQNAVEPLKSLFGSKEE